jgi:hypothetical protein
LSIVAASGNGALAFFDEDGDADGDTDADADDDDDAAGGDGEDQQPATAAAAAPTTAKTAESLRMLVIVEGASRAPRGSAVTEE